MHATHRRLEQPARVPRRIPCLQLVRPRQFQPEDFSRVLGHARAPRSCAPERHLVPPCPLRRSLSPRYSREQVLVPAEIRARAALQLPDPLSPSRLLCRFPRRRLRAPVVFLVILPFLQPPVRYQVVDGVGERLPVARQANLEACRRGSPCAHPQPHHLQAPEEKVDAFHISLLEYACRSRQRIPASPFAVPVREKYQAAFADVHDPSASPRGSLPLRVIHPVASLPRNEVAAGDIEGEAEPARQYHLVENSARNTLHPNVVLLLGI
mmetsp:Transcript_8493/g.19620  ORF Transcript_8493/g.19620 Transcript_8493/m.19620 type:complete len:267 (-) Transcript_8493:311-1111(-)